MYADFKTTIVVIIKSYKAKQDRSLPQIHVIKSMQVALIQDLNRSNNSITKEQELNQEQNWNQEPIETNILRGLAEQEMLSLHPREKPQDELY